MLDEIVGGQGDMSDKNYQLAIEEWYKDPTDKWKQKDVVDAIESNTGNRPDFEDVVSMAREDLDENTRYQAYATKDIGTNYREELTTLSPKQRKDIIKNQIQELNDDMIIERTT
jgi:hypothetical protein